MKRNTYNLPYFNETKYVILLHLVANESYSSIFFNIKIIPFLNIWNIQIPDKAI